MEHPGKRLRRTREKRQLTQLDLAQLVKCHDSYISQIEAGKRGPGLRLALAFEKLLGIKAADWVAAA
jgi:transcriptional regulator with XRE-family HTH domain